MIGKRGAEKYLSLWWFLVLVLMALAVVAGVAVNTSSDANTREFEAGLLMTRAVDCLISKGYVNEQFMAGNFDIFSECSLDKEMINESAKYYLKIEAYKYEDCDISKGNFECKNPFLKKQFGVVDFENQCKMTGARYPRCAERYAYALYVQGNEIIKTVVHFFAGSNEKGTRWVVGGVM